MQKAIRESATFLEPLIAGLHEEGSYQLKAPCNGYSDVNADTPRKCLRGSPWISKAQQVMGGSSGATIKNIDNFHQIATIHSPGVQNNKVCGPTEGTSCVLNTWTVTQNVYDLINAADTGGSPQGALEMEAKMLSTSDIQFHSGVQNPNFLQLDGSSSNKCQQINKMALQWALSKADPTTLARYNRLGNKLTMGNDIEAGNTLSWIKSKLNFETNGTATQTVVSSSFVSSKTYGTHYCKILSPYRALEWIYIDSLYAHYNRKPVALVILL